MCRETPAPGLRPPKARVIGDHVPEPISVPSGETAFPGRRDTALDRRRGLTLRHTSGGGTQPPIADCRPGHGSVSDMGLRGHGRPGEAFPDRPVARLRVPPAIEVPAIRREIRCHCDRESISRLVPEVKKTSQDANPNTERADSGGRAGPPPTVRRCHPVPDRTADNSVDTARSGRRSGTAADGTCTS